MSKYLLIFIFCWANADFGQTVPSATVVFHAGNTHTGVYTRKSYRGFGPVKWKFKTGGKIFSSPIVCNGVAYIGSADHNLYAIDITSGKQIWKFTTGGAVNASPAVFNNILCFGSYDGSYYALNAKTGVLKWRFKTGGEKHAGRKGLWTMKPTSQYMEDLYDFFLSSPVFDDNGASVYFGSGDGNLYAVNTNNGKLKWAYRTDGLIHTSPALYNGKLYFGSWDTYFYVIDATAGKLAWKFKTGSDPKIHLMEGIQSSAACSDGLVYFGARDGYLYALNAVSGKMAWKYSANGSWILTTPAVQKSNVYATTSDTYLFFALDAKTGKQKFKFKANGYLYSSPALAANTAFFGDYTGKLLAVNLTSGRESDHYSTADRNTNAGKLLKKDTLDYTYLSKGLNNELYSSSVNVMNKLYTLGPIVSSPVISNGVIYFGSADGYLYAIVLK